MTLSRASIPLKQAFISIYERTIILYNGYDVVIRDVVLSDEVCRCRNCWN